MGDGAVLDLPNGYGPATPVTDGTRAFVFVDCQIHAITLSTGVVAWSKDPGPAGCVDVGLGGPAHGGRKMVLVVDGSGATAYDAASGGAALAAVGAGLQRRPGHRHPRGVDFSRFGGSGDSTLTALDLRTGAVMWENEGDDQYSSLGRRRRHRDRGERVQHPRFQRPHRSGRVGGRQLSTTIVLRAAHHRRWPHLPEHRRRRHPDLRSPLNLLLHGYQTSWSAVSAIDCLVAQFQALIATPTAGHGP